MTALAFPINGTKEGAAWQPQRFRYWYDGIIDLLLVDPTLNQKQIATKLGRSAVTIGLIMNSDLFRLRYEQRRGDQSAALRDAINAKLGAVALKALETTEEVLNAKRAAIPLEDLVNTSDKALERLGYGAKPAAQAPVAVTVQQFGGITADDLRASRAKYEAAQQGAKAPPVLEGDVVAEKEK